ncbi:hypothetical protein QAD02_005133 [Eretmocerus hayati]|uniref:Uncharacterized protein n=1 Tax=Eretmocerus hayati TaxID=131215 RepID=A0ACC2NTF1_9HYME|nr:hypothetical protein QAD02_005133 [Eretmocerus hayati]
MNSTSVILSIILCGLLIKSYSVSAAQEFMHGVREAGDEQLYPRTTHREQIKTSGETRLMLKGHLRPEYYITQVNVEFKSNDGVPVRIQNYRGGYKKNWYELEAFSATEGKILYKIEVFGKKYPKSIDR